MATIANLMVRINGDTSGLTKALGQAEDRLASAGKAMTSLGQTMTMSLTLPIAGAGAAILKTGMEFESTMSSIKAVSGATAKEMETLSNLAMDLGSQMAAGPQGAAEAIEELIKAGVSVETIMNGGLKGALDLAAAGEIEVAKAAEIASTALNAFRKDNLSVTNAADILAGAAAASATDIDGLSLGLSQVAAVASGVGMSFKDTNVALALFAQNGLKGSDSGTSLKTMLMGLIPKTNEQIATFKKLNLLTEQGTSAFFDANGRMKSLRDISDLLRRSLSNMSDEQRLATLETMFGSDAIRAANILYQEGADGVEQMTTAMEKITAAEVAAEKMNNLQGSLILLKSELQKAAIELYAMNSGPLKDFVDKLDSLVEDFSALPDNVQQTIVLFVGFAAAIGPALMIIGGMASGVSALGAAFTAMLSPVGLVIGALIAVAAGVAAMYKYWEEIPTWVKVIATLANPFLTVVIAITALIKNWEKIGEVMKWFWDNILTPVGNAFLWLYNEVLTPLGNFLKDTFVAAWDAVTNAAKWLWDEVLTPFGDFLLWFKDEVLSPLAGILNDVLGIAFQAVADIAKSFWDNVLVPLADFFKETFGPTVEAFSAVLDALGKALKWLWDNAFKPFGAWLSATLKPILLRVVEIFEYIWKKVLEPIAEYVSDVFVSVFDNKFKTIGEIIDGAKRAFKGLMEFITGVFTGDWEKAWNGISEVFKGIVDGITSYAKGMVNGFVIVLNGLTGAISKLKITIPTISIPSVNIPGLGEIGGGSFGGWSFGFPDIPKIPELNVGTNLVAKDGLAMIHKGEAVVPKKYNPAAGGSGGNDSKVVNVYLDGNLIDSYVDNGMGRRLNALGVG